MSSLGRVYECAKMQEYIKIECSFFADNYPIKYYWKQEWVTML